MKIDPSNRPQPPLQPPEAKPQKGSEAFDFARVLEKERAAQQMRSDPARTPLALQPAAIKPSIAACEQRAVVEQSIRRMLDALERYQHLLADTTASLRAVAPAIQQIKKQAASLGPLGSTLPDAHPLREILNETLMMASKEMVRFDQGDYIDD